MSLMSASTVWGLPAVKTQDPVEVTKRCLDDPVFGGQACTYEANAQATEAVVLVHGINGSALTDWAQQIPVLAKKYHVLTFDLPGFGASEKGNRAYTPENYARFVRFVTGRFLHEPFFLVGHSLGASIALYYAAAHPQDVKQLVLIDAAGILYPLALTKYNAGAWFDDMRDMSPDKPNVVGRVVGKVLEKVERLPLDPQNVFDTKEGRRRFLKGSPTRIAALALAYQDFGPLIDQVSAPVLIIWGSHDTVAPVRTGRVLANRLHNARLEIIDGAGHMSMRERADVVNKMLIDYFARTPSPQPSEQWESQPPQTERDAACRNRSGVVYTGQYRRIDLDSCGDVVVHDAWVEHLTAHGSRVRILDTSIVSTGTALSVSRSDVTITNTRIEGHTAIHASGSRLDIANGELVGETAAVKAERNSNIVFSVSRIASPYNHGTIHRFVVVTPDSPL